MSEIATAAAALPAADGATHASGPELPQALRRDFAVLIPAYNEVESLPALFAAIRETFARHGLSGEVVLVDDGSSDGTYEAALREGRGVERLRVLRHRRNQGKTEAMLTAAAAAESDHLILFDADLQHSPEEFPRFLAGLAAGWDIVTGRKVGAYQKRTVSSVYNWLSQNLFDVPVRDLNSMKAFRREVLADLSLRHDWHRFFVVLAHHEGFSVSEIPIPLFPRRTGVSKYTGRRRVLIGVGDLVVVWFYLKFSEKPMQFFGASGLALIAAGLLVGVGAIALRFAGAMPPFGYRPLLTLVLLLETVGFMLFGFGLVAELIATLRIEVDGLRRELKRKPPR